MKKAEMELIQELFNRKDLIEGFLKTFYSKFSLETKDIARCNMSICLSDEYGNNVSFLKLGNRDAKETIECIESRLKLIERELDELSVWGLSYLPEALRPLEVEEPASEDSAEGGDC